MKKLFSLLLLPIMALSLLTGCSNTNTNSPTDETTDATTTELSGTMKVVATSESYVTLFDKFTQDTGVDVELLSMSSGELLSKLRAEGGTPSADLWFGGGVDAFMSAKDDGLLEQVTFEADDELDATYRDADGYWYSKGLTIVGFLVNNTLATELNLDIPTSWEDLLDEQYAGEIIMSNPAISGTNYGVVNCLLQVMGEDAGWTYFNALNENIAYYGRRGSDPMNKVIADEYAIGITYLDGTIDALLEQYDVTIVYPSDGIPYIPEGVAVFKGAENVDAAKYFVEWLYSDDENLQLLAEIDKKTAVKVIKPSMEGVDLAYDTSSLVDVDVALFGSQRNAILEKFEVLMGDKAVAE